MSARLFPRLERHRARDLLEEMRSRAIAELSDALPMTDLPVSYSPVGGPQVQEADQIEIRDSVRDLARQHGFPQDRPGSFVAFDALCAGRLHSLMRITPHEAAHEEVWTHLTLAVLLDVAAWRFPNLPEDRVIGTPNRNAFRRLWWRAEILHEPGSEWTAFRGLGEDELVQIMERPTISGSPKVARTVMNVFADHEAANAGLPRMQVMRDAMRRVMRLTPFVALDALPAVELTAAIDSAMRDAIAAVTGHPSSLPAYDAPTALDPSEVSTTVQRLPSDFTDQPVILDGAAAGIALEQARGGHVTNQTLREATGLDSSAAREVLFGLVEQGLLEKRGSRRGTHYVLRAER